MKAAKFDDISLIEQKQALGILARDGKEAMMRYVSRVHVDDIHFLYARAERSPAEQGPLGVVIGNLILFPRAYWEKLTRAFSKMSGKDISMSERMRGFKILLAVIAGGLAIGSVYQKVTGRKDNPYNPIKLLAYQPGGLMTGIIDTVGEVYYNMIWASVGDQRALSALTTFIPRSADMFIPLYMYLLRGIEAMTDTKNIDRKALRQIRELVDKEYSVRGGAYKLERNAMDKWRYFIAGAGIDIKNKEEAAKKKKKSSTAIEIPTIEIPSTEIKIPSIEI